MKKVLVLLFCMIFGSVAFSAPMALTSTDVANATAASYVANIVFSLISP